ncbi:LptF/LptG family permease [Cetobacterium somerae]|uniref:LptF/LptG family permease n=1 Tax=Cetobacterium sp. NK01 TaxID=2993530 RepID=UPI002116B408|nr:LptF/LptG family permease [Cetobacterium sp. NK01]MCQ8212424.1 LptF/LptG family permease [Cetobacterium sp. NK01]
MKKLDIYISKNFIKSFLLSLIAFINIFILSQLFKIIRYITAGRMSVSESATYILYLLPKIFIEVTPLAVLLGSLMCINKMASNLEIISLKTSGISFRRIARYPIIISFFISLIVFQVMNKVHPMALAKSRALRAGRKISERVLPATKNNAFLRTEDNLVYYIRQVDRVKNTGSLIEIIKLDKNFEKIEKIITAKTGIFSVEKNSWILKDAVVNNLRNKTQETYKTYSNEELDKAPEDFITIQGDPDELTNAEIRKAIRDIRITGGDIKEPLSVLGKRYSFPFASFIVSFLGLSLGSRYVRGASAISIALSVGLGYSYYIVQASFEALSVNGILNPFVSGWIPNIIFLSLGIYFMKRAEY